MNRFLSHLQLHLPHRRIGRNLSVRNGSGQVRTQTRPPFLPLLSHGHFTGMQFRNGRSSAHHFPDTYRGFRYLVYGHLLCLSVRNGSGKISDAGGRHIQVKVYVIVSEG